MDTSHSYKQIIELTEHYLTGVLGYNGRYCAMFSAFLYARLHTLVRYVVAPYVDDLCLVTYLKVASLFLTICGL